jgi:hypothetical protein
MKTITMLTVAGAMTLAAPAFADDSPSTTPTSTPSAEQQCRTERTKMGADAFAQLYGTNVNKRNAFGRCVSKRSKATAEVVASTKANASQECRAEETSDPGAFAQKYGTGKKGANAHGRCVSQKAKAEAAKAVAQQVNADVSAAKACKAERTADPKAFAVTYGRNTSKHNAFGTCVSRKAKAERS